MIEHSNLDITNLNSQYKWRKPSSHFEDLPNILHLIQWIIRYSEQKGFDGIVCYIEVWVYTQFTLRTVSRNKLISKGKWHSLLPSLSIISHFSSMLNPQLSSILFKASSRVGKGSCSSFSSLNSLTPLEYSKWWWIYKRFVKKYTYACHQRWICTHGEGAK